MPTPTDSLPQTHLKMEDSLKIENDENCPAENTYRSPSDVSYKEPTEKSPLIPLPTSPRIEFDSTDLVIDEGPSFEKAPSPIRDILRRIRLVIFMVGFSEGLTHLATLATYYLFKDDLGLSPAQVSLLFVAPAFPWFLKPLFAFYSDSYPLFGMRRKPYLLFFAAFQAIGYVMLAYGVNGVIGAVLSLFVIAFSASFCSAIAEALLVELGEGKRTGASDEVSDFTMAKGVGSILVAYFSGYMLEKVSKKAVFLTTAGFPLMILLVGVTMSEVDSPLKRTVAQQVSELTIFLQQQLIWGPAVFILAFMCGPDYDDALFFYYTNVLGFRYEFMGTLRFTYGVAAIAGTLLYRYYLYNISYRKLLWSSILISLPIYLSPILLITGANLKMGISNAVFVLSGGFLNEAVAEVQLMPLLILTACICPPGLEGSAYSTMFAVRNLGSAMSKTSSAIAMSSKFFVLKSLVLVTGALWAFICTLSRNAVMGIDANHFKNLTVFVFICGAFNLLPFFFIHLIPTDEDIEEASMKKRQASETMLGRAAEFPSLYGVNHTFRSIC